VVVAEDLPALSEEGVAALCGAAAEALVNAGKHGGATCVQVYGA
jgi:signal transduction histidine kinase